MLLWVMKFKKSRYNHFIDLEDNTFLCYNALSNSLAVAAREDYNAIMSVLHNPNDDWGKDERMAKIKEDLFNGSFLQEEIFDEVAFLQMKNKIGRFGQSALSLTIAPTMACNFDCSYCFEKQDSTSMTDETAEALLHFISEKTKGLAQLSVTWFGGEPTLRLDIIEKLVAGLQKIAHERNLLFPPMGIITNGYLLDKTAAKKLKELNIQNAQITIDGAPKIHNMRRPLKNRQGTFERIIQNIIDCKDIIGIHIRVNIDKQNITHIDELLDILQEKGIAGKTPLYFSNVQANTAACADLSTVCFTNREHSALVVNLLKKLLDRGIGNITYPSPHHFGFCTADRYNGYVIAPNGNLFKCWCEIGSDSAQSVGSIGEHIPDALQINNLARYLNWDPFQNEECRACDILPVCSGGCPYNASQSASGKVCIDFRHNLKEMLALKHAEIKHKGGLL